MATAKINGVRSSDNGPSFGRTYHVTVAEKTAYWGTNRAKAVEVFLRAGGDPEDVTAADRDADSIHVGFTFGESEIIMTQLRKRNETSKREKRR